MATRQVIRTILLLGVLGLTARCTQPNERRRLELIDDQQESWSMSRQLNTEPELFFEDRIYKTPDGKSFSGTFSEYHKNGVLAWQVPVSRGRIHGEVLHYYPNGQLAQRRNYQYGILQGPFEEWYPKGDLKLKGRIIGPAGSGGDEIVDFTVGFYSEGKHQMVERKSGRIQMINSAGRTPYENEMIELTTQEGYMLFGYTWWGTLEVIATDSRGEYAAFQDWDNYEPEE
ncbi:hypothetical protein HZ996_00590 [Cryomorphaceae bacterium]|nr:hypothetical protein HZ996_00590 [Cryomorphaceae bacterium]